MANRTCDGCGGPLHGRQRRFCSEACRAKTRRGGVGKVPRSSGLAALAEQELTAAGRLDSIAGQQALMLAKQMSAKVVNVSGISGLSREFSRVYASAMAGVKVAKDPVDELMARRDAKRLSA